MSDQRRGKRAVFAVVRFDHYLRETTEDLTKLITVKEVVFTQEEAEAEVARLNRLAADQGRPGDVEYFFQYSRLIGTDQ